MPTSPKALLAPTLRGRLRWTCVDSQARGKAHTEAHSTHLILSSSLLDRIRNRF